MVLNEHECTRMNGRFLGAAAIAGLTCVIHVWLGGREVAQPLLASGGLGKVPKFTNYYCWHLVTIVLAGLALAFGLVAWHAASRDLGRCDRVRWTLRPLEPGHDPALPAESPLISRNGPCSFPWPLAAHWGCGGEGGRPPFLAEGLARPRPRGACGSRPCRRDHRSALRTRRQDQGLDLRAFRDERGLSQRTRGALAEAHPAGSSKPPIPANSPTRGSPSSTSWLCASTAASSKACAGLPPTTPP